MARLLGGVLMLCLACTSTSLPSDGSCSPFASGSTRGSVQGSDDFAVSQTIRYESGAIHGTLTYTGTCDLVKASLRFSYVKNGQTVTDEEADGVLRDTTSGLWHPTIRILPTIPVRRNSLPTLSYSWSRTNDVREPTADRLQAVRVAQTRFDPRPGTFGGVSGEPLSWRIPFGGLDPTGIA
jgi:hypothetical protein